MEFFKHPSCNAVLGPARGDEANVVALPVYRGEEAWEDREVPFNTSYWKPSAEELAALNAGGSIALTLLGRVHPPVRLEVQP